MNEKVYKALKNPPKLKKTSQCLTTVNGKNLNVLGCAHICFQIKGLTQNHLFYIVRDMNRNLILGNDWLTQNGVRLYFDLGCLRIGNVYVPIEHDIHIASILRLKSRNILKPQTSNVCLAKIKDNPNLNQDKLFQISQTDSGYISSEPGLMISNAVVKMNKNREVPILIVNNTDKTFNLNRGCIVGKLEVIEETNIASINEINKSKENDENKTGKINRAEISAPPEHRKLVEKLLFANEDLFAAKDTELGHTDTVTMKIDTGDHPPIRQKPYRTPLQKRQLVEKAINEMLEANIIRKSRSPWSSPIILVKKFDGSERFCVDMRKINAISKTITNFLPNIDSILTLLNSSSWFSTLDLKSGYWQILMDPNDRPKTAFVCHIGLFEFNCMPFGLKNAPAIFSELMNIVLDGLDEFAIAYLDDILIYSKSLDEHLKHIKIVFERLRKHGLKLKLKKCNFMQKETKYLGFVINENGVKPDPAKVEAIRSIKTPETVKEVRSFIGMSSFYRRFIPNFSKIAEPIIKLTKKYAKFNWTNECQIAFDYLKESLSVVPLLAYPDVNKPYKLYCDASDTCIGACLTQECSNDKNQLYGVANNEKPIFFLSHRLSRTQEKWPIIEKEAYAIHYALQKLDHYLHGAEFVIKTDHKPLKYILESPMQNKKIQVWALNISSYNAKIEFLNGQANLIADLLSRSPPENEKPDSSIEEDVSDKTFQINTLNSNNFSPKMFASCKLKENEPEKPVQTFEEFDMLTEQQNDPEIMQIIKQLNSGVENKAIQKKYLIIDQLLYYITNPDDDPIMRLYIPSHIKEYVITQYHDKNGHMGIQKVFETIKQKYFWPNMYKELYEYISNCMTCQMSSSKKTKVPLQETDIPPFPFAKIALDLSGPFPTTLSGNRYIVTFIDLFSGWPEAFAVPNKDSSNICHIILEEIFPRFSTPLCILSDNAAENLSRIMKETLEALNIHHITTSFYSPTSNARLERCHRSLNQILSKKIKDNMQTWDMYLNQALAAIRFSVSESSKFSPFFLLYNRDPVLPLDNILKPRRKFYGDEEHKICLEEQHKNFVLVHKHLKKAKTRQAKYANKNAKDVKFEVGDAVYFKNHRKPNKLAPNWQPYYRIIKQTSPVSFIIKNQLDGSTTKSHANHLRLANVDEWVIPTDKLGRKLRKTQYVVSPEHSSSDNEISTDTEEDNEPLIKIAKRYRRERQNSSSESDIPKMELAKRLQQQDESSKQSDLSTDSEMKTDFYNKTTESEHSELENEYYAQDTDEDMSVNAVKTPKRKIKIKRKRRDDKKSKQIASIIKQMADML